MNHKTAVNEGGGDETAEPLVAFGSRRCPVCARVRAADPFSDEYESAKEWHVHVSRHGETVEVYPTQGDLLSVSWWIEMPGLLSWRERWGRFRLWYPKSEVDLERGIRMCQRYCEQKSAQQAEMEALVANASRLGLGARGGAAQ